MKRNILIVIFIALPFMQMMAEEMYMEPIEIPTESIEAPTQYRLAIDPITDGLILGATSNLALIGYLFLQGNQTGIDEPLSYKKPNWLDSIYVAPRFSATQDKVGTALMITSMAMPIALLFPKQYRNQWLTYGVLYGQSLSLSYVIKEGLKTSILRYRPYSYYYDTPSEMLQNPKIKKSFPSGHTTFAFQGAAFLTTVAIIEDFPAPWKYGLIGGSMGLAVGTAVLRVTSGAHYITDVLAGAALGSMVGVAVPLLHRKTAKENPVTLGLVPSSSGISIGWTYKQ